MVETKTYFKKFMWLICGVMYLITLSLWIVLTDSLTLNLTTSVLTLLLTMIMIVFDRDKFRKFYQAPHFNKLVSLIISIFLVFCILGVINYLAYKNPFKVDLSSMESNSLTPETINILKKIKGKIHVRIFGRKGEILAIQTLIDMYRFENHNISIEPVDIELRPDLVKKHNIYKSGTIEIEYNKRVDQVTESSELAITNSLLRLTRPKDPLILFTKGHGEMDLGNKGKEGLSTIHSILSRAYFNITEENTLSAFEIKDDVDLVVIWGPKSAFMPAELQLIENYINRGGKLLIGLDPTFNGDQHKDLRIMLSRFGLVVDNNIVIDQLSFVDGSSGSVPMISKIKSSHPILQMEEGPVFFPLVSAIRKAENLSMKFEVTLDLKTSHFPASWADNNPEEMVKGKVVYNIDRDTRGPIDLMGISKIVDGTSKVVAFGNSTFVSNAYEKYGKNFNLFTNAVSWLVRKNEIDEFNLPLGKNEPVFINRYQIALVFYVSVLLLPLIFIIMSIWFYRRKKHL